MANILVTGANGFLGRRLCELWNPEDRIIKVDLYGNVDYINDLTSLESFQKIVRDTKPDLIIHLAALSNSIGLPNNQDARALIGHNVLSSFVVSQAISKETVPYSIIAGSMAEYGNTTKDSAPPAEEVFVHCYPTEAYALSKMISSYLLWPGQPTFLRFANIYGPGQKDKVISKIIMTAIHGGTFYISGNGQSTRQYLYVDDAVEAIKKVYQIKSSTSNTRFFHQDLNVGPKKETSLFSLIASITYEFGFQLADLGLARKPMNTVTVPTASLPDRVCMDSTIAYTQLGWEPQISLEEGLRRTIKAAIEEYYGDC